MLKISNLYQKKFIERTKENFLNDITVAVPKYTSHDNVDVSYKPDEICVMNGSMRMSKKEVREALSEYYGCYRICDVIIDERNGTVLIKYLDKDVIYHVLEVVVRELRQHSAASLFVGQDKKTVCLMCKKEDGESYYSIDDDICCGELITEEEQKEINRLLDAFHVKFGYVKKNKEEC